MDWIRRNWPDLLIGVALVAVIVMIVATLLSGGSLLSLIRRDAPAEPQPSAVTAPLGPTETAEGDAEPGAEPGSPEAGAGDAETAAAETADVETDTGTQTAAADTADAEAGDIDPFIPEVGSPQTGGETLVAEGEDGADEDATGDDLAGDAAGAAEQAPQDADGAPSEAVSAGGGLYRVAAGAIGTQEGATTLAQSYRSEGYQVSVEPQGDLFLLWVGPYESEADAESAAQSIRDAGGDALVYSFGGAAPPEDGEAAEDDALGEGDTDAAEVAGEGADGDGAATNTGTGGPSTGEEPTEAELADVDEGGAPDPEVEAPETETPETETEVETELGAATVETADVAVATATDTEADTGVADAPTSPGSAALGDTAPETTAPETTGPESAATGDASGLPSAPAGGRYLQVGAFASEASSEPLRAQLENLDFEVTSSETATGLTRLYIGPFDESQLQEAQTELAAQGLDSFPVAR